MRIDGEDRVLQILPELATTATKQTLRYAVKAIPENGQKRTEFVADALLSSGVVFSFRNRKGDISRAIIPDQHNPGLADMDTGLTLNTAERVLQEAKELGLKPLHVKIPRLNQAPEASPA